MVYLPLESVQFDRNADRTHTFNRMPSSKHIAPVKLLLIYGYLQAEVNAGWEWFFACIPLFSSGATTILDDAQIELIAVGNRSHNIYKLCSGTKKVSSSIKLAAPRPAVELTPAT